MPEFLYVFGFETPAQSRANHAHGWDDEDSRAVFIEADSAELALEWGRRISERFIRDLYRTDGAGGWSGSYAHWIAEHPKTSSHRTPFPAFHASAMANTRSSRTPATPEDRAPAVAARTDDPARRGRRIRNQRFAST